MIGILAGEITGITLPTPPRWILVPVALFPMCAALCFRAYNKQFKARRWLEKWSITKQKRLVGHRQGMASKMVEELWLETHTSEAPAKNPLKQLLESVVWWSWLTLISLLALVYLCLWFGLRTARLG